MARQPDTSGVGAQFCDNRHDTRRAPWTRSLSSCDAPLCSYRSGVAHELGVEGWLSSLGLGKYAKAFADNEIDGDALPLLTEEDLKELGLPIGPRRKVLAALKALDAERAPARSASASSTAAVAPVPRHLADRIL